MDGLFDFNLLLRSGKQQTQNQKKSQRKERVAQTLAKIVANCGRGRKEKNLTTEV